jgi:peptidoglycan/LPS O-acetylase OafA/YrhL
MQSSRLPGIDVLRGMAVLLVVIHHIHLRFRLNQYDVASLVPKELGKVLFSSGYYSVITFFVISGFLITSLSLRRWGSLGRIPLLHFYRLRAARILPCLLLLLTALSVLHLAGASDFLIKPERASLGRALVAALTFHLNWLEGHRSYLPGNWDVLWSLSVEETFYVLFPLLCLAMRRERWLLISLFALIVVGPFNRVALEGQDPLQDYDYLSCMDGIAFGCIAAWITARVQLSRSTLRLSMTLGVLAVMLIEVFRATTFNLGLTKVGLNVTILEIGIALILMSLAQGVGHSLLSTGTAWLQLVGRCSYEIYLTHMFVVLGLMHPFKALFGTAPTAPSTAAYWTTYGIMLALSVLFGYVVQRWFSEPVNEALRGNSRSLRQSLVSSG